MHAIPLTTLSTYLTTFLHHIASHFSLHTLFFRLLTTHASLFVYKLAVNTNRPLPPTNRRLRPILHDANRVARVRGAEQSEAAPGRERGAARRDRRHPRVERQVPDARGVGAGPRRRRRDRGGGRGAASPLRRHRWR